ncbi:hypothetical protein V8G54_031824 [Vigna mungo]|uniref:Uncharacterized protein n=1 Tax=Vigna mungo TaxID=3915 RepID=A0AAQ3MKR2_VIGMU
MGRSSNSLNNTLMGAPNSLSIKPLALLGEKAGTLSCNFASSSTNSRGNRSDLVDDNCPSLMKVGPSCNTLSLSHAAVFCLLFFCFSSVKPPKYAHFALSNRTRIRKERTKDQTSIDLCTEL